MVVKFDDCGWIGISPISNEISGIGKLFPETMTKSPPSILNELGEIELAIGVLAKSYVSWLLAEYVWDPSETITCTSLSIVVGYWMF